MSKKSLLVLCFALVLGAFTGYVDMTATEVQAPMLCILVFSFLLGFIEPKKAWLWAIIIGLSLPIATFVGLAINFKFAEAPPRFPIFLAVLVIPALIAAYGAVFLRHIIAGSQEQIVNPV